MWLWWPWFWVGPMTIALPDNDGPVIAILTPANAPRQRHVFAEPEWAPPHKTPSGRPQTERTCTIPNCGVVKVTVHEEGGGASRAWRYPDSTRQFDDEPPCPGLSGAKP